MTTWTFGRKVGLGFAATVALAVLIALVATFALRSVVASKDRVIDVDARILASAERLDAAVERKASAARGYLLSGDREYLDRVTDARTDITTTLATLQELVYTERGRTAVRAIGPAELAHQQALDVVVEQRRGGVALEQIGASFDRDVAPRRDDVTLHVRDLVTHHEALLGDAREAATATADAASQLVVGIAIAAVLAAGVIGWFLTRSLSQQIGGAVGRVESSSAELQAAANQQATGAREQATAMQEITTTITELLATSRQIAESAQRVAQIAGTTANAARTGDATVVRAQESIAAIRRQTDLVVTHMLDLGRKSQQIGGVLDIVSELAEQTNILAINATIEAAGAGEAGRRFAVVADEIRKLADRVGGSTKEIRGLIEDVRAAVNTTVMATESGSKAVDAGARQFSEVTGALQQIGGLVGTTTEAAREIELSTKQQSTAVEQVNVAISNVAQATRETEASSGQTLETASELASLSRDLLRLVQPQAA